MLPIVKRPCENAWERRFLGLDVVHPVIQTMATEVRNWCHRVMHNKRRNTLLVLAGRSGTGKSHAARYAIRFCQAAAMWALDNRYYDHPLDAEFYSWPEIADGFKNGEFGVMADLFNRDAIAIDDIGAEHDPSSMATEKLCQVLSRRDLKHTIVTTNYLPESWGDKFDARIADRLLRNSVIVDLSAVDSYALTA